MNFPKVKKSNSKEDINPNLLSYEIFYRDASRYEHSSPDTLDVYDIYDDINSNATTQEELFGEKLKIRNEKLNQKIDDIITSTYLLTSSNIIALICCNKEKSNKIKEQIEIELTERISKKIPKEIYINEYILEDMVKEVINGIVMKSTEMKSKEVNQNMIKKVILSINKLNNMDVEKTKIILNEICKEIKKFIDLRNIETYIKEKDNNINEIINTLDYIQNYIIKGKKEEEIRRIVQNKENFTY